MKMATFAKLMTVLTSLAAAMAFSTGGALAGVKLSVAAPRISVRQRFRTPATHAPALNTNVIKSKNNTASSPVQNLK
jgi:hypothetical protein